MEIKSSSRYSRIFSCGSKWWRSKTIEIDNKTFESKLIKIYFAGEVLDIVGNRGGFNLHFAWASGYLVGKI